MVSTRIVSSLGRRWRHRSKLRDSHSRLLGRYEGATNLEQICDNWENWLREKCSTLRQLEFLYVEPKSEKGTAKSFRLIRREAAAVKVPLEFDTKAYGGNAGSNAR